MGCGPEKIYELGAIAAYELALFIIFNLLHQPQTHANYNRHTEGVRFNIVKGSFVLDIQYFRARHSAAT